jgi:hypothetical protein
VIASLVRIPLALEGQWSGASAVAVVAVAGAIFIGSIYYILSTLFGLRRAYYIVVASFMGFLILLSTVWLVGIPGTGPGFGPRGREPAWIPFLPSSEFAADFKADLTAFPNGWDEPGKPYFGNPDQKHTGAIDSKGEIDTLKTIIEPALAGYYQKLGTGSVNPADYNFRQELSPADTAKLSDEDKALPVAVVRFKDAGGGRLLFGADIPASAGKHPEVLVFAMRDKGTVFLPALYFLMVAVTMFTLHLWLLARDEKRQKQRDAETAATPTMVSAGR